MSSVTSMGTDTSKLDSDQRGKPVHLSDQPRGNLNIMDGRSDRIESHVAADHQLPKLTIPHDIQLSVEEEMRRILRDEDPIDSAGSGGLRESDGSGELDELHNNNNNNHSNNKLEDQNEVCPLDKQTTPESLIIPTEEAALGPSQSASASEDKDTSKISAYARLDFENFTFFVQTLQVVLGRKSNDELLQSSHHAVDVHLSSKKAISRRHAKIFYNFGTQRFELSIMGRNGAFVDDLFVEKGITVPLLDGSKIQIGDIPFLFVLPSLDPFEGEGNNSLTAKPFNPSDAINLRSSLYSGTGSASATTPSTPNKKIETKNKEDEIQKDPIDINRPDLKSIDEPIVDNKTSPPIQRDIEESRKSIQRRMSLSRRKSLATASIEEINDILKELGPEIDAIDEEGDDSDFLDAQIQAILDDHGRRKTQQLDLEDDSDLMKLTQFTKAELKDEEDEIDQMVKQHNLEQGVRLDDDEDIKEDGDLAAIDELAGDSSGVQDLDLSGLDQEIATLAPLIDAHHQELLTSNDKLGFVNGLPKKSVAPPPFTIHTPPASTRGTPLMGKPAAPRMGRPASIQPPASRLYGRPLSKTSPQPMGGLSKAQLVNNRLTTTTSPLAGLPTHLVALLSGLPLKVAHGSNMMLNHHHHHLVKPMMPPKPPPPILEAPVVKLASDYGNKFPKVSTIARAITTSVSPVKVLPACYAPPVEELNIAPKYPRKRKDQHPRRPVKKVYTLDEIPEQYRIKPTLSYPLLISNVLRSKGGENGLTTTEVAESIKEAYPYYKYCADGWQFSINHNLALNRVFKRINQRNDQDKEWVWGIDDAFINDRQKVKVKQQEIAAAKAKAAAIRAEEIKQKQRLEVQQATAASIAGRPGAFSPYALSTLSGRLPQSQFISQLQQSGTNKPKTIAELASEIRRDGLVGSKAPLYFKPQDSANTVTGSRPGGYPPSSSSTPTNIKAQLAANRASPISTSAASTPINNDTKKSLAYLQKELFTLYKARKLSYNTATTTEIITKALATTIAQVNVIGAKAGCGDNALSFLVEKAPQQVSKILDIALSKSIKEKQGILSSRPTSRSSTPGPGTPSISSPKKTISSTLPPPPTTSTSNATAPSPASTPTSSMPLKTIAAPTPIAATPYSKPQAMTKPPSSSSYNNSSSNGLVKPPLFNSKPPTFNKQELTSLSRPPQFTSANYSTGSSTLSRPPPQFLSNKPPSRPSFQSNKTYSEGPKPPAFSGPSQQSTDKNIGEKREHSNDEEENRKKIIKIE